MNESRHDRRAERAVLAAMIDSNLARQEARRHITGADFWEPVHERIWEAMARLDKHEKPVDPVTLLAVVKSDHSVVEILPEIITTPALPDSVGDHAEIVRGWAIRRRIQDEATRVHQQALNPDLNPVGFAAKVANTFAGIRDSGVDDELSARMLSELLAETDDEPDWLIPGFLERRDRLMLTGEEGLGKSHLLRQFALMGAAGLDPWDAAVHNRPIKAAIIDCENTWSQVRRKLRPAADFAARYGEDPRDRVMVECSSRMDITRDKDLARIHHMLDAQNPDLVVIGPLYRLVPRALQTDDDAAPVLAALDTIRDRGIALLIEAHAGHAVGKGGTRDMRPRGSSALLGWPEFGMGMRGIGTEGYCDLIPWRGNREERDWPKRLRRGDGYRWLRHEDLYGWQGESA
ncbi:MAG TPA: AAA family ATPase [Solirubrobacteraceae bacterium]|nr:AAA family ATPase [Solirubrobacteraceae bacterium]